MAILVGDGRGPLRFSGVNVWPDVIEAHVEPTGLLRMHERGSTDQPLLQTTSFDISFDGPDDRLSDVQRHARAIAERDDRDLWSHRADAGTPRARRASWYAEHSRALGFHVSGIVGFLLLLGLAWFAALVLSLGRARIAPSDEPVRAPMLREIPAWSWVAVGVSAVPLVIILSTFHFIMDDFDFLRRFALAPWTPDAHLRWLSLSARFSALGAIGSPAWSFAALNLLTLLGTCVAWGFLLRRAGCSRSVAFLSAVLASMGPGAYQMIRWASGFEHLSAELFCLLTVVLVDVGLRGSPSKRWRVAALSLAAVVCALGMFTKAKVMIIAPPAAGLWAATCIPSVRWWLGGTVFALLGAAVAAPVYFLLERSVLLDDPYGADDIGGTLTGVGAEFWSAFAGPLLALVALVVVGLVRKQSWRPIARADWRTLLVAGAAIAIVAAPFVAQGEKFPSYYAFAPAIPATALVAGATVRAARWSRLPTWAFAVVLLAWAPASELTRNLRAPHATGRVDDGVWSEYGAHDWLVSLRESVEGQREPTAIHVTASCDADSIADVGELERVVRDTGIHWTTGWLHVPVVFQTGEREVPLQPGAMVVDYCRGVPARWSVVDAR
jgi:hypothetical protein